MNTAIINIKTDPKTKKEAQEVLQDMGLSLSAGINGFLKQIIRTKTVHFSLDKEYSEYFLNSMKQANDDLKKGQVISFSSPKKALNYVDKMIRNDK